MYSYSSNLHNMNQSQINIIFTSKLIYTAKLVEEPKTYAKRETA